MRGMLVTLVMAMGEFKRLLRYIPQASLMDNLKDGSRAGQPGKAASLQVQLPQVQSRAHFEVRIEAQVWGSTISVGGVGSLIWVPILINKLEKKNNMASKVITQLRVPMTTRPLRP